jgi:hypothetical protein
MRDFVHRAGILATPDGRFFLNLIGDEATQFELSVEGLASLLGAILQTELPFSLEHDGLRVGQFPDGHLALEYRFGPDHWLPIRLLPDDLESLRLSLLDDPRFRRD